MKTVAPNLHLGVLLCCPVAQPCPTLCDLMDYSTPGSPVLCYWRRERQTTLAFMPQEPHEQCKEGFWYKHLQHLAQWWDSLWAKVVTSIDMGFPGSPVVKNILANAGTRVRPRFDTWVEKIPWRRVRQPTPVFLSGKFHGQRSLVGGGVSIVHGVTKEVYTTEHAHSWTHTNNSWMNKIL